MVRLELGRFEMKYGDQLVIGASTFSLPGQSFEGLRLHFQETPAQPWVDVFATTIREGSGEAGATDNFASGDRWFVGAYAGLGSLLIGRPEADLYLLGRLDPGTETASDAREGLDLVATLGARVKGAVGRLDYRAEGGVQGGALEGSGDRTDRRAYQGDGELGLTLPVAAGLRVALEGVLASGDDPATLEVDESWTPLYPSTHDWLGWTDYIGTRTNVASGVLHLQLQILRSLRLVHATHYFARPFLGDRADAAVGVELDTAVLYQVGRGLGLQIGWNFLFLDEAIEADPTARLLQFSEVELRAKF